MYTYICIYFILFFRLMFSCPLWRFSSLQSLTLCIKKLKFGISQRFCFCLFPQKKEWTWDESKMMVMQDPIYR